MSHDLLDRRKNLIKPRFLGVGALNGYEVLRSNQKWSALVSSGTLANRPASGTYVGDVYYATDTDVLYVWEGASWGSVQPPSTLNLNSNGYFVVNSLADPTAASNFVDMNTTGAITASGFGSSAGFTFFRIRDNGTLRLRLDWSAGNAIRWYAPGRMDFESAGQMFFTGTQFFMQAHISINRTGDASSTATQKDSYGNYFQNSLWTGAASTQRFSEIRSKASTTVNLAHRLAFFLNVTGGVGTDGTEVMALDFDGTLYQAHFKAKFGYPTGQGGTVTQATSKATGVTLSKLSGQITMNNAALAAGATVSFTLTNTLIEANDHVIVTHRSAGTGGAYNVTAFPAAGSATIYVTNVTAGSLSEAIVLQVTVIKGAIA